MTFIQRSETEQLSCVCSIISPWIGVVASGIMIEVVIPFLGYSFNDTTLWDHVCNWVVGGRSAGVVGSLLSEWPLTKQLCSTDGWQ